MGPVWSCEICFILQDAFELLFFEENVEILKGEVSLLQTPCIDRTRWNDCANNLETRQ